MVRISLNDYFSFYDQIDQSGIPTFKIKEAVYLTEHYFCTLLNCQFLSILNPYIPIRYIIAIHIIPILPLNICIMIGQITPRFIGIVIHGISYQVIIRVKGTRT